jgi:hypothetical protein
MEKMEIESGWENEIWWKIEEKWRGKNSGPTILSRFRPKE